MLPHHGRLSPVKGLMSVCHPLQEEEEEEEEVKLTYQAESRRKGGKTEKGDENRGGAAHKGPGHLVRDERVTKWNRCEDAHEAEEAEVDEEGPVGEAVGEDEGGKSSCCDPSQREVERLR